MYESLGDRIKTYENAFRHYLPIRMPVILRCDGKSFSTLTNSLQKPFDANFNAAMESVGIALCTEIQNARMAFIQSDEVSVLITPYTKFDTQPWVEGNIQKTVSIAAAIAASTFTLSTPWIFGEVKPVYFDARVFIVPKEEVNNALLWRQQDASRNSISMLASSLYSHKELLLKDSKEKQEMIYQKSGMNWNDLPPRIKRGCCIIKKNFKLRQLIN